VVSSMMMARGLAVMAAASLERTLPEKLQNSCQIDF